MRPSEPSTIQAVQPGFPLETTYMPGAIPRPESSIAEYAGGATVCPCTLHANQTASCNISQQTKL